MLTPSDEELGRIHEMAIKVGILSKPISMSDLIDREFIPADIKPANIVAASGATQQ
jgi:NitT/TauT family transport system substrate-binding protein